MPGNLSLSLWKSEGPIHKNVFMIPYGSGFQPSLNSSIHSGLLRQSGLNTGSAFQLPTSISHSILRTLTMWRHLDQLRIKLAHDLHQVGLCQHDFVDVLVNTRHLVEPGGDQFHTAIFEDLVHV